MPSKDSVVVTARLRKDEYEALREVMKMHGLSVAGVLKYAIAKLRRDKPSPRLKLPEHPKQCRLYKAMLDWMKRNNTPKLPYTELRKIQYSVGIMTDRTLRRYLEALEVQGFIKRQRGFVVVLKEWEADQRCW